jgi:acetyl/propionyl-CoA carboxylase alpha subunit
VAAHSRGVGLEAGHYRRYLAVVEAMKMQNVLRAERDGTVKKIHAAAGATLRRIR